MTRYGRNSNAERVELMGADISRSVGGQYRLNLKSGLLTLIAAQTSSAGHVAAFRNIGASPIVVDRIAARWWTTTGFTSAQEVGMGLVMARSYTASHTGGTAATIAADNGKKNAAHLLLTGLIDFRMGTTTALTAGTHTLDSQNFADAGIQELAASATVPLKSFDLIYEPPVNGGKLVLAQNEGFVLANHILGGTAGVWRVSLGVDFQVVDPNAFLQ
jgi:hypothetical protein